MLLYEIIKRENFLTENGCHKNDSLIIVLDGVFNCKISGKEYIVKRNDMFAFNKNTIFERKVISPIRCLYIQFDKFPIALNDGIVHFRDLSRIQSTFSYLEQSVTIGDNYTSKHFIDDIFILYNQNNIAANDSTVLACIDFFEKNFHSEISLDILTEKFHISKQWLILKFKKFTNKTPMEYLNEIRLQHSQKFLTDTDISIGEIAEKCGYANLYYFSNAFKKETGLSPLKYRQTFQL